MITQIYKQGEHKIKIESVESLDDAEKNGFKIGEYSRYYVNGKLTDNYMAMIRFIVDESKANKLKLIPSGPSLMKMREEMFSKQANAISEQLEKLKKEYSQMDIPNNVSNHINDFINKINPIGIRTIK